MNESFELDAETLDKVAGGLERGDSFCKVHEWEFVGREKGRVWGYNLRFRCAKCKKEEIEWD